MGRYLPRFLVGLARWRTTMGWLFYLCAVMLGRGGRLQIACGLFLCVVGESFRTAASGIIRKNRELATGGPYAMCRHPLYFGSFLIAAGLAAGAAHPAVWAAFLLLFPTVYGVTMRQEEAHLATVFGPAYEQYRARVPLFFPGRVRLVPAAFSWRRAVENGEHLNWIALLASWTLLIARYRWRA